MAKLTTKIQLRRDTAANLADVVLAAGEPGFTTDTQCFAVGDGVTPFKELPKNFQVVEFNGYGPNSLTLQAVCEKINALEIPHCMLMINGYSSYQGYAYVQHFGGTNYFVSLFDFANMQVLIKETFTNTENLYIEDALNKLKPLVFEDTLDGYVTLDTAQTISGVKTFSTQQKFTVANGTSPFTVASSTKVTNLNADLLDGKHASEFQPAGNYLTSEIDTLQTVTNRGATTTNVIEVAGLKSTGNVSIYAASGATPYLLFQRGTDTDSYNDWGIFGTGGSLYFNNRGADGTWQGRVSFLQNGGITLETGNLNVASGTATANSFIKRDSSDSYVLLGGGGHKALSEFVTSVPDITITDTTDATTKKIVSDITASGNTITVSRIGLEELGLASAYKYQGTKANFAAIQSVTTKETGDVYNAEDTGMNYAWTGSAWDALGSTVDLSSYATKTDLASYLPLAGNTTSTLMTGSIKYGGATREIIALAPESGGWRGGLKYSWDQKTTIALWGANKDCQFVWHAGANLSTGSTDGWTNRNYDFQVGRNSSNTLEALLGGKLLATQEWVENLGYVTGSYLPLAGGTMTGDITITAGKGLVMKYTSGGDHPWMVIEGNTSYGIRYKEGSPDTMMFSASGNNTTAAGADLCINGNGDGTVTMRGKNIATQNWVESKGYLTEHQSLTGYVKGSSLTKDTIILGNDVSNIKTSSKTISTAVGTDDTTVPTSKAVVDYINGLGYVTGSYLPLAGSNTTNSTNNMTGPILFKDVNGIILNSNNKDVKVWSVWGNAGAYAEQYGFHLLYKGTGGGNDNSLHLYAHDTTNAHKEVYSILQDGTTTWKQSINFTGGIKENGTALSSKYQALDADLTAIAGLAGNAGLLKKTGANTWTLDTNTYLTEAPNPANYYWANIKVSSTSSTATAPSVQKIGITGSDTADAVAAVTMEYDSSYKALKFVFA